MTTHTQTQSLYHTHLNRVYSPLSYKDRANQIFSKLQSLHNQAQNHKSTTHTNTIKQIVNAERILSEKIKHKENSYNRVLELTNLIESELQAQKNQELRCRKNMEQWLDNVGRNMQGAYDQLQKDRLKTQSQLQKHIATKIQSFILKNQPALKQRSLICSQQYATQLTHLHNQHHKYLGELQKEIAQFKKEAVVVLMEFKREVKHEISGNGDDQQLQFMRMIHIEISSRIANLTKQRQSTQQRFMQLVQRIIEQCLSC